MKCSYNDYARKTEFEPPLLPSQWSNIPNTRSKTVKGRRNATARLGNPPRNENLKKSRPISQAADIQVLPHRLGRVGDRTGVRDTRDRDRHTLRITDGIRFPSDGVQRLHV